MNMERVARTVLGAAALSGLLVSAGCNGGLSSGNSTEPSGGTPIASIHSAGDWGAPMLAGGTVGVGMYPAKFTWDVTAAPSCANDYVAFNTSLAGAANTTAASQTGTFAGVATAGRTVTITGSNGTSIVLTSSAGSNTGFNFQNTGGNTSEATNLAAAIVRNGAAAGVTASSLNAVVTVTATATGGDGNLIALATNIVAAQFTWAGATLTGGMGSANIIAFNQLYASQSGSLPAGLCGSTGPSVYWSYFTGTGTALTSIVLSLDGAKVAFVENDGTNATLRILRWQAGEGTTAGKPVAPANTLAAGQNWTTCPAGSCMSSIAFSGGPATATISEPFYNYPTDVLYVGDNSGRVHKFTGVFLGAPAEVVASWPITVNAGATLTSPIYDGVSGNIFVGDSTGRLSFIREVGSTVGAACTLPCLSATNLAVGTAGAIVDGPVVDGTNGTVFAVNGTDTANRGTILQASTALTGSVSFKIGGNNAGSAIYSGGFDNTYINSAKGATAGHMYVCGKSAANRDRPGIYQLSFTPATGVLSGVGTALINLVSASGEACSPVTEFNNPNGAGVGVARDWIFFSIGNRSNNGGATTLPAGSACRANRAGCVISINVTGNPAWPPAAVTNTAPVPASATGSTSGFVVDNTSVSAQASSFYFTLGANSTGAGPGVPSCNTTAGTGCAVKLTQSGLQ